jgi:hypothetical protein
MKRREDGNMTHTRQLSTIDELTNAAIFVTTDAYSVITGTDEQLETKN